MAPGFVVDDDGTAAGRLPGGMLAKGFGPETIAVGVVGVTDEADVAGAGNFLFDAAQIGVEFGVGVDAEDAVLKGAAQFEGHGFLDSGVEGDGFDLPAELLFGFFSELHAHAGRINAAAPKIGKLEDGIESVFDLGESFVEQLDAEAIPDDVADLFANVDDGEVMFATKVDADVEGVPRLRGCWSRDVWR